MCVLFSCVGVCLRLCMFVRVVVAYLDLPKQTPACAAGKYKTVGCVIDVALAQNANLARSCGPNRNEACPTSQVVCESECVCVREI